METTLLRKICEDAFNTFGSEAQFMMVVEECGELLNALAKYKRGRATEEELIEEVADVSIMMEELANHFNWNLYIEWREYKLLRLKKRIDEQWEKAVQ